MSLRDARSAGQALKNCVQENQDTEALHLYLRTIEGFVREMEAMTVSARTQQTKVDQFFVPLRAADKLMSTAGAKAK